MQVFECPGCKKQLIGSVTKCQFCGADVTKTPRPVVQSPQKARIAAFETPKWVWTLYYALAIWWIVGNGLDILLTVMSHARQAAHPTEFDNGSYSMFDMVGLFVSAVLMIVGVGLLLKRPEARKIVRFAAGFRILMCILQAPGALLAFGLVPELGGIWLLSIVISFITACLTLWILGETAANMWDD